MIGYTDKDLQEELGIVVECCGTAIRLAAQGTADQGVRDSIFDCIGIAADRIQSARAGWPHQKPSPAPADDIEGMPRDGSNAHADTSDPAASFIRVGIGPAGGGGA